MILLAVPCMTQDVFSIPDGIKEIDSESFSGCTRITEINIPESVISLSDINCFTGCDLLKIIDVSEENSEYSSADGVLFNKDKTVLISFPPNKPDSYSIPISVTAIGNAAFSNNISLRGITIPESVKIIEDYAFCDFSPYIEYIDIPNSVTEMGENVFMSCDFLIGAHLPEGITKIEDGTFNGCDNLKEIHIPDGVTEIGEGAFGGCRALAEITIPESVVSIGDKAFAGCIGLYEVILPIGIKDIGKEAFRGCTNIEEFNIPCDVAHIGAQAIADTGYYNNDDNWDNGMLYNGSYLLRAQNTNSTYEVKQGTILIADEAFRQCYELRNVKLPDSVEIIGQYSFMLCALLETVEMPDSIKKIDAGAFGGCSNIEAVHIPNNITYLGDYAFFGCGDLREISLPNGIKYIGNDVFWGTLFYETEGNWSNNALYVNQYLLKVKDFVQGQYAVNSDTVLIANGAFEDCKNVKMISLPNSIKFINQYSFYGCDSLQQVMFQGSDGEWQNIEINWAGNELLRNSDITFKTLVLNAKLTKEPEIYSFSVDIDNEGLIYDKADIVAALYDINGCLCAIIQENIFYEEQSIELEVYDKNAYSYKIMLWDAK